MFERSSKKRIRLQCEYNWSYKGNHILAYSSVEMPH